MACAGPLCRALLADGPTSICFSGPELLEVTSGNRVVLLNAARDADYLNAVRPVIAEHELRVFVWLKPGDRATLRQHAPDFLDWMQQSIDVPAFLPEYATRALKAALNDGESITWEGPPLVDCVPGDVVWLTKDTTLQQARELMENGPVVVGRVAREKEQQFAEIARSIKPCRGIVWDEPLEPKEGAQRIIADAMEWELASIWFDTMGVAARLEAACHDLDPVVIATLANQAPPDNARAQVARQNRKPNPEPVKPQQPRARPTSAWEQLFERCQECLDNFEVPLERPPEAPGLVAQLVPRLDTLNQGRFLTVSGASGSGLRAEFERLEQKLRESRVVVTRYSVAYHDLATTFRSTVFSWLVPCASGLAALRFGNTHGVQWGSEFVEFTGYIESITGLRIDTNLDFQFALTAFGPTGPSKLQILTIEALASACIRQLQHQLGDCLLLAPIGLYDYTRNFLQQQSEKLGIDVLGQTPFPSSGDVFLHDIPVVDPQNPANPGPSLTWFRKLTIQIVNQLSTHKLQIPNEVIDRLAFASGGRPRAFLYGLRELARHSAGDLTASEQLAWSEQHVRDEAELLASLVHEPITTQLRALLRETVTAIPNWPKYSDTFLCRYPTPDGGHRFLPHPLLIDHLEQGNS